MATALLLPIAFSSNVIASFWSPKAALLLIAGAVGLSTIPPLLRTDARASAAAALAYVAVAIVATVASPDPIAATVGLYNYGTGLVFLVCCVGLWALGSTVPEEDRWMVVASFIAGTTISAAVGVLQSLDLIRISVLITHGRAQGLAGNPVHLATLSVGVAAIASHRARTRLSWAIAVGMAATIVQLTGTRLALVLVAGFAILGAVRARRGLAVCLVLAVLVGVMLGSWLDGVRTQTPSRSATARVTQVASGSTIRVEVWSYARHAVFRRPILGNGPGRFRAATSADRSIQSAQIEGGETIYADAHNMIVEHLVTVGVIGTGALIAIFVLGFRRARGDLAWCAFGMLVMSLLQPLSVGTTPLLFLFLGCASSVRVQQQKPLLPVCFAFVGVAAAGVLLVGDVSIKQAIDHPNVATARRADRLMRPWPEPATVVAQSIYLTASDKTHVDDRVLSWYRTARRRDPTDPRLTLLLADEERAMGRVNQAEKDYREALAHNPYSVAALQSLAEIAEARGDDHAAAAYARRFLQVQDSLHVRRILQRVTR